MLTLNNVTKRYQLGASISLEALKGIYLTVAKGDFVAICGPSGSGKSTLLNIMGCLDSPTSGSVTIKEVETSALNDAALSRLRNRSIGFIFQSFNLIPVLSAWENVEYPLLLMDRGLSKKERGLRVDGMLAEVGLHEFARHRPDELSGGQRQRVAIARALAPKPELVLADEPTANLDSSTGAAILELMKKMNQEHRTTFVFSTHDQRIMGFAHKVHSIEDGRIQP